MATWVTLTCAETKMPLHLNLDAAYQIEGSGDQTLIWYPSGSDSGDTAIGVVEPVQNVLTLAQRGLHA